MDDSPKGFRTWPAFLLLDVREDSHPRFRHQATPPQAIAPKTLVHAGSATTTKKLIVDTSSRYGKSHGINLLADSTSSRSFKS